MDKPTCGTCHLFGADGFCYLPEPQIGATHRWPRPAYHDWCTAHQDWQEFIATRTPLTQRAGDVPLVAVIRDDPYIHEPVTISREDTERIASLFADRADVRLAMMRDGEAFAVTGETDSPLIDPERITTPPTAPPSPPPTPRE